MLSAVMLSFIILTVCERLTQSTNNDTMTLCIITLRIITLSLTTFIIAVLSITTLSKMTLSIIHLIGTFSISIINN
jgi:hypothetical protein